MAPNVKSIVFVFLFVCLIYSLVNIQLTCSDFGWGLIDPIMFDYYHSYKSNIFPDATP